LTRPSSRECLSAFVNNYTVLRSRMSVPSCRGQCNDDAIVTKKEEMMIQNISVASPPCSVLPPPPSHPLCLPHDVTHAILKHNSPYLAIWLVTVLSWLCMCSKRPPLSSCFRGLKIDSLKGKECCSRCFRAVYVFRVLAQLSLFQFPPYIPAPFPGTPIKALVATT